jgi:polyketide biosynthesis enoyl-CoA hydratase PksH
MMDFETLNVRFQDSICFVQFDRPEANNTINDQLIEEFYKILAVCEEKCNIIVLEGSSEIFCNGADFQDIHSQMSQNKKGMEGSEQLYNIWVKLASGPYVTISHVRGKANASGVGFVAASDIVLADETAHFSLSELLFGLFPAMVLPFLIRRIGVQKSHYLTLMTKAIPVQQAFAWGLVDAYKEKSSVLLQQHLQRLKILPKSGIARYKKYMSDISGLPVKDRISALSANKEIFSDPQNLEKIFQFVENGKYPWED